MLKKICIIICAALIGLGFDISGLKVYGSIIPDGFDKTAETNDLALYVDMAGADFILHDKRGGHLWKSFIDETNYNDYAGTNNNLRMQMQSLIQIFYTDLTRADATQARLDSGDTGNTDAVVELIPDGCRFTFTFKSVDITIALEITLAGDTMIARLPADGIQENSEYGIVTIALLPFFGAADRTVSGYMFYPDGSGALTIFENQNNRSPNVQQMVFEIYGSSDPEVEIEHMNVLLPVMGVKIGDNAFVAAITEGSQEARVIVRPDGFQNLWLNRQFFDFIYRSPYQVMLSGITISESSSASRQYINKFTAEAGLFDRETVYFFLTGSQANYSGMANTYRNYLESSGQIKSAIEAGSTTPVHIDFFMGASRKMLIFNRFISMTSFKQAEDILKDLIGRGVDNIQQRLIGWGKGGYSYFLSTFRPERRLGGAKRLRDLSEMSKIHGFPIFLNIRMMMGEASGRKFSPRRDVAYSAANLPINIFNFYYMLNPSFMHDFLLSCIERNTFGAALAIDHIGYRLYRDFNRQSPSGVGQTMDTWRQMLIDAGGENGENMVAVTGGNLYTLAFADRILWTETTSSNYRMTDETIPFYQMIVHGNIPYAFEEGTAAADFRRYTLRCIEYGAMPRFTLTHENPNRLADTDYSLFSSEYNLWADKIAEVYAEFTIRVASIWSAKMVCHEKLTEHVVKIGYSNGETIYINYGQDPVSIEGFLVGAEDFIVVEEGGGLR